jgi:hypothetical protein
VARTEVGAARVGGSIYVVGGFAGTTGQTTDQVARYEIASGRWEVLPPLPIAVNHPGVAAFGGQLYVHGGYRHEWLAEEVDALQRYDPETGVWTLLSGSGFPRAAHTLVRVGARLFAIGGAHNHGVPLSLVQVYKPASDSWSTGPSMPTPREHLAAAAVGRRIFVLGGRTNLVNMADAERLDTRTGRWKRLPPLRFPRSGFGAASVKGAVIAIGGEVPVAGGAMIPQVEIYLPGERRWRRLPSMPTPRHGLGVASRGRTVFALEGGPQPQQSFTSAAGHC